ncbi:MAG: hypothetical protein J6D29_06360 [Solobacterium sp.]|nr:hypothetical protein [Solobacterium sp.]
MQAVYAILIAGVLVGMTVLLTVLNKKTPVPEGCENLGPDCHACGIVNCAMRQNQTEGNKND